LFDHRAWSTVINMMRRAMATGFGVAAISTVTFLGMGMTTAGAEVCTDPGHAGTQVCGNVITPPNRPTDPDVGSSDTGRSLPFTGGDVAGLVVVGVAALGAGTVLVRVSRRSPQPAR
jgi:hypothetical protein